jgi:hypothetical protein
MRSWDTGETSKNTPPAFLTPLTVTARTVPLHSGLAQMTILIRLAMNSAQQLLSSDGVIAAVHGLREIVKHVFDVHDNA